MEDINRLDLAVLSMMQTQMILADKSIKKVLSVLGSSEEYCRVIKECASNFDFIKEYDKYIVARKSLPKNKAILVSLVVGLLYRIDCNEMNILDMLKELYPNQDTTISYPKFTNEWLVSFVDVINYLAFGQPYEDILVPKKQTNEQLEKDIELVCRDINYKISLSKTENKDELYLLCNELSHSLKNNENTIIKAIFIGLSNSLYLFKINCDEEIEEIESILKIYGVL